MLRMRLRRVGKKKQPMYRIVIADSHSPRDGRFVESIGYYHPMDNPSTIVIDNDRAKHWLDKGAMPSERVSKLLAIQGLAEIPAKVQTRIALGVERAKEAEKTKAEAKQAEAAAAAEAPAAQAPAEAPAAEGPAAEEAPATEETPAAEDAPGAEAPATEETPAAEDAPAAEAPSTEETPAAEDAPAAEEAPAEEEKPAE